MINSLEETWCPIIRYGNKYMVSSLGQVKSINYKNRNIEQLMVPSITKKGYMRIKLSFMGTIKTKSVHRLVLESFNPTDDHRLVVNHKNGIRNDNRLDNLEWVTVSENTKHGFDCLGRTLPFIKSISQYTIDGMFIKQWNSIMEASKQLKIAHSSISQCCNNASGRKTCGGFKWSFN